MLAGDTPLIDAARHGRVADVWALLEGRLLRRANVKTDGSGATALYIACQQGHTEVVAILIAAGADVNKATNDGRTPLYIACQEGHTEIVMALLAANANVNQANIDGWTPLIAACRKGHTEIAAKLIAANADVEQAANNGATPMVFACFRGRLGCVRLLSSYGARRRFAYLAPHNTAENIANHRGHHDIAAWLAATRLWTTPLHHLEFITPPRALLLLRAGADIHAAVARELWVPVDTDRAAESVNAEPVYAELVDDPTPLSIARALAAAGRATEGTAAFLVLEAAKPWSRQTHKYFPAAAQARAVELTQIVQFIKRGKAGYKIDGVGVDFAHPVSVADVFEAFVMPHMVTRDYQPPQA